MTISSKASRVVYFVHFRANMNDTRYTRAFNWTWTTNMQKLTMIVYTPFLSYKIAGTAIAGVFFYNFIDGRFRFCMYLSICGGNVSSIPTLANLSFVRNFTLVRIWRICVKISNNPYRFFGTIGIISRDSQLIVGLS